MAFTATTIWEVETGGDDTNFGGGFDTGVSGFPTDGAATVANSAAPVFTSASYTFLGGDVGAWVYIKSGTNWTPGWYKITSVNVGAATLDAAIGHAVLATPNNKKPAYPNVVAGCATTASPTGATWGLDYSQSGAAGFSSSTFSIDASVNTTLRDGTNTIGKNWVGNIIKITSGGGFTVQRVAVVSTSGTAATVDKSLGTLNSTGGVGKVGGALATRGQAGALMISGNDLYVKTGTYTDSTTSANTSGGPISLPNGTVSNPTRMAGYNSVRGDGVSPPTFSAGTQTSYTMVTLSSVNTVENITCDGNSKTSVVGIDFTASGDTLQIGNKAINCPGGGIICGSGAVGVLIRCWAVSCASVGIKLINSSAYGCIAKSCTGPGFTLQGSSVAAFCISSGNTGGTTDGFVGTTANTRINCFSCVAFSNGRDGFRAANTGAGGPNVLTNCIAVSNTGVGFNVSSSTACDLWMTNCFYYNNGTNVSANVGFNNGGILGTGDPFVSSGTGNFALNNTAGAGSSCRNAGILGDFPDALSTGYLDIGAVQVGSTGGTGATASLVFAPVIISGGEIWE